MHPTNAGASRNFGAGEQWTGHVFSVICQVHTTICVAVETLPISGATVVVLRVPVSGRAMRGSAPRQIGTVCAPVDVLSSGLGALRGRSVAARCLDAPDERRCLAFGLSLWYAMKRAAHRWRSPQRAWRLSFCFSCCALLELVCKTDGDLRSADRFVATGGSSTRVCRVPDDCSRITRDGRGVFAATCYYRLGQLDRCGSWCVLLNVSQLCQRATSCGCVGSWRRFSCWRRYH